MGIRLGAIGIEHAIKILEEVVKEYPEYSFYPYIYQTPEEISYVIEAQQQAVDVWLVFGQMDESRIQKWGKSQKPVFCIPYRGASLFKILCEIFYKGIRIEDISFDTIPQDDLKRGFDEMNIVYGSLYVKDYANDAQIQTYIDYHADLWDKGKIRAAVTGIWKVKDQLELLGIPAYCVLPVRVSVRTVLNMILREFDILRLKDAQIAVQVFDFELYTDNEKFYSMDDLYNEESKMFQKLISYAKIIQGSLKSAGQGRFFIFTTRGMLAACTDKFTRIPALKELEAIERKLTACGIGIGMSANEAELHAVTALMHARRHGNGSWVVIMDDKEITGPLGRSEQLTYRYFSRELQDISDTTSISVGNLSKIVNILQNYGRNTISAQELAVAMQILPRSARRILTKLEEKGLAQAFGEETPHSRGRPRKVYTIQLDQDKAVFTPLRK
jgi:DNA-binding MarR family transcriptional regulator